MYALPPRPDRLEARSPDHCSSSSSRKDKGVDETNYIADAIASIRLAISHHDPYEEWSNQTKREARVRFFGFFSNRSDDEVDLLSSEQLG
jgi:hypothetical protein